ncbi:VOC family protein [Oceanobacillus neutriphilus]|uniref:Glyoxalase-like domain-containing protein n=1 Tax=Oceanobacillus neutriphilus TaxID=531815 RepID=A0ABQ2NPP5_9BACI|nr:VOC family protein [Oceanobacillus neutriphilus]GGP08675.1 hypothetical protein GCM10011346_09660 [Oceanobacillus neutriphilus]
MGKRKFVERLNLWDNAEEGILDLCLEGTEKEFKQMKEALERRGQRLKLKRTDTRNGKLAYQVFFPFDLNYPFFMTHFHINPRPIFFTHPNGSTRITKVNYPIKDSCVKKLLK